MEWIKIILLGLIILLSVLIICFILKCYLHAQRVITERPIKVYYEKLKILPSYCKLEDISPNIQMVVLALEDTKFFQHNGYVLKNIYEALVSNLAKGKIVKGGSTITQQLAKNMYFSFVKTYERKIAEFFVARKLENILTKEEILDIYFNVIFYGMKQYGIKNACEFYFQKHPSDISLNEAITIACMLPTPLIYNPLSPYKMFPKAREQALKRLCRYGLLKEDEIIIFMIAEYNDILPNKKEKIFQERLKQWYDNERVLAKRKGN